MRVENLMSNSASDSTTGRKCTVSQRVLENADPLVLRKKARVVSQIIIIH